MTPTTITRADELAELLEQMLNTAENADETGYVTDCGFIDLDKLHSKVREALTAYRAARSTDGACDDTAELVNEEQRTFLDEIGRAVIGYPRDQPDGIRTRMVWIVDGHGAEFERTFPGEAIDAARAASGSGEKG